MNRGLTLLLAIGMTLLLFAKVLPSDRILLEKDIGCHFIGIKARLQDALLRASLPAWTRDVGCGFPLLAEPTTQAFYPSSLLLFFFSPAQSLKLQVILHFIGIALAAAVLARQLGASRPAASLGGLILMASGPMSSMHWNILWHAGLPWWLLAATCVHRIIEGSSQRASWLGLAACTALQALAGAFELLVALGVFSMVDWTLALILEKRKHPSSKILANFLVRGFWLASAAVLGSVLAAAQILPTLELLHASVRANSLSSVELSLWSLPPGQLVEMLAPNFFGNPSQGSFWAGMVFPTPGFSSVPHTSGLYLGIPTLALAFAGLLSSSWNKRLLLGGMALCLVLLSLGEVTPLLDLFRAIVPGVRSFRYPAKFLTLAMVPIAILAALGADALMQSNPSALRTSRRMAYLLSLLVGLGFCGVLIEHTHLLEALASKFSQAHSHLEAGAMYQQMLLALAHGAGLGLLWIVALHWRGPGFTRLLSLGLPVLDLILTNQAVIPWSADEAAYARPWVSLPPPERFQEPSGMLRMGVARHNTQVFMIEPFQVASWGYRVADKYGATELAVHPLLGWCLQGQNEILRLRLSSVALALVKNLSSTPNQPSFRCVPIDNPMPRASLIPKFSFVADDVAAAESLRSEAFDPRQTVLLESDDSGTRPPSSGFDPNLPLTGQVEMLEEANQEVRLRVEASRLACLLLTDSWYPGWSATIDGESTPLFRANVAFRAVFVPEGKHEVVFRFESKSLRLGIAISGLAWLGLLGVSLVTRKRRR